MPCKQMNVGSERASSVSERAGSTARRVADTVNSLAKRCSEDGLFPRAQGGAYPWIAHPSCGALYLVLCQGLTPLVSCSQTSRAIWQDFAKRAQLPLPHGIWSSLDALRIRFDELGPMSKCFVVWPFGVPRWNQSRPSCVRR
jgi:hypothetical protein